MIKRITKWIPKLKTLLPKSLLKVYDFSTLSQLYEVACQNLVDLQEHYDICPYALAKGHIKDFVDIQIFKSNSQLKSIDLFYIGKEAMKVYNYESGLKWLQASIKLAKQEEQKSAYLSKIRYFPK